MQHLDGARQVGARPCVRRRPLPQRNTTEHRSFGVCEEPAQRGLMGGMSEGPLSYPPQGHPDPLGRHQLRYYDGARWTEHVSDGGVVSADSVAGVGRVPPMPSQIVIAPARTTNKNAVASLVLSVLWILGVGSLLAVLLGLQAVARPSPNYSGSVFPRSSGNAKAAAAASTKTIANTTKSRERRPDNGGPQPPRSIHRRHHL